MTTESASLSAAPVIEQSASVSRNSFRPDLIIVWVLFLLSGSCGLIYEVLWCRHLGLIFGNTSQSLSAVLTAFMGGLAFGSFIAGRMCHRIQRPLFVYGVLEVLIGIYCALLPMVFSSEVLIGFYRSLYGEAGSGSLPIARFVISFGLLLIPTTFMGATLPLLSHFLVRSRSGLGRTVGALYAVNSLGAVLGAVAAGFLLLPVLGKSGSNWVAVVFNLVLGVLAIAFGFRHRVPAMEQPDSENAAAVPGEAAQAKLITPMAVKLTMLTFGITGFAAMATQIGWTRAISLGTGSSTYAFSLIVAVFILGLSSGGWWGSRVAPRTPDPLVFLARLLLMVGLFCFIVATVLGFGPILFFFLIAWGSSFGWEVILALQAAGIGLLIIAPTFLMGATMPLTIQVASRSAENAGKTVGNVYAINTLGSILGSFFGGLLLIPAFQIQSTLEMMALLYALPGVLLFSVSPSARERRQLLSGVAILIPLILMALASRRWDEVTMSSGIYLMRDTSTLKAARELRIFDAIPNLSTNVTIHYYKEGAESTVAIMRIGDDLSLRVGGKPDASSRGDMATQIGLTLVPEILHAKGPEEVLVIGLGSGVSVGAALAPESVKRVDVVEMSPEVVVSSWWFQPFNELNYTIPPPTKNPIPPSTPWLQTPKVEVIINDGRNHLLLTSRMYDVIASEPSNPWMAGVGNLFTKEAFDLCRAHLKPGGIMCQWLHSYSLENTHFYSVVRTFAESYKHVQLWQVNGFDYLLIGSESPLELPLTRLRERLASRQVKGWMEKVHLDRDTALLSCLLSVEDVLRERSRHAPLHTDDNMLLEFQAPRAIYDLKQAFNANTFIPFPERSMDFTGIGDEDKAQFIRNLDLAVAAREQNRYYIERHKPPEPHGLAAYALDPYNAWAIEQRNKEDYEQARRTLAGFGHIDAPDAAAAARKMLEAKARSKFVVPPYPPLNTALRKSALKLIDEGKLSEAEAEIAKIDLPPKERGEIALLRARLLLAKKDYPGALALTLEASNMGQSPLACAEVAALIQERSGHAQDAILTLKQTLSNPVAKTDKDALPLWSQISRLLLKEKQWAMAHDAAVIAETLDKQHGPHLLIQAQALMGMDRMEDALKRLRQRVSYMPMDEHVRVDYARALLAAAQDPRNAGTLAMDLLFRMRRTCHEQTVLQPEAPTGWELLCRAYLSLQKCDAQNATQMRAQAFSAWQKLISVYKGDISKAPPDLAAEFK
ncbi:MAG TPA: fused MFS/spermidine synthase [Planctomycetota bacterium]|nr:fused MFS/spermidine synthase [Planctomycetota bacterium]